MNVLNTGGLTAEQAEALFNLANNGVLTRIDERGKRCEDLYQWGLHPHTAETGSALAADDDAFTATYPLTLAGPQAVTEHALFPAMSAAESLHGREAKYCLATLPSGYAGDERGFGRYRERDNLDIICLVCRELVHVSRGARQLGDHREPAAHRRVLSKH